MAKVNHGRIGNMESLGEVLSVGLTRKAKGRNFSTSKSSREIM